MKANEAPEKIYMTPSFGEPDNVLLASFSKSHLDFHRDIEYTRTDAFIDKACELLARMVWEVTYEDLEGNSVNHSDKMEFIEDFKKYMKGE